MEKHEFPAAVAAIIAEARRQQALAQQQMGRLDAEVSRLRAAIGGVQAQSVEKVKQVLSEATRSTAEEIAQPWRDATVQANNAANVFRRAANMAPWRMFVMATVCVLAGISAMAFTARAILPDWETLQKMKQEEAALNDNMALLRSRGAGVKLVPCRDLKQRRRLCAQVDDKAGVFPDGYHILRE